MMTEEPENDVLRPASAAGTGPIESRQPPAPHRNRILIGTLFTVASLVGIVAVLAVWANRQVLNTNNWNNTSSRLLADKEIQTAAGAYAVSQLFNSGVVQAQVRGVLPPRLQAAAGPVTAGLQQLASQLAPKLLASSQVQGTWRQANRTTHAVFLKLISGDGNFLRTNGGVVTLDLHAIVTQLAATLGIERQVAAVRSTLGANAGTVQGTANKIGITLPPASGRLVIMRSSQLKTAQDIANDIKGLSIVLPLLTFALFALAVALSRGHRRPAVRMTGWCFVGIGLVVLLARRVLGNYIVDALVKNPSNRPAVHNVWAIATTLLYDIAAALVVYGLVFVVATWLAGHTRPATALRRALAPTLRLRPAIVYATVFVGLLLVILWGPTPATRQVPYIIGFAVLLVLGVEALRRQTAREYPEAQPGDTTSAIRAWSARRQHPPTPTAAPIPTDGSSGRVAELERLAQLHDRGSLTDTEFAAEKAALMSGS